MPLQIPHPETATHLYRHLLREATYLPQLCRSWIFHRIQDRFRAYRFERRPTPYIRRAHASLRYLRSANSGHLGRLERLCLMATGRVGKRRRTLLTDHLSKPVIADTAELKAVVSAITADPLYGTVPTETHDWLENWSVDKILALARSQLAHQNSDWPHNMRREIDPEKTLQRTNCFDQPPAPRLARNRLKKHFALLLDQIQAPLPEGEWQHLKSLVLGSSRNELLRIPVRRRVAGPIEEDGSLDLDNEEWDWSRHVLYPARKLERGNSRKMKSLTGKEDLDPRGHGRPIGVRFISAQVLQRIYRRVWEMSPLVKRKPGGDGWTVEWGHKPKKLPVASAGEFAFFQGVGKDGKVPKPPKIIKPQIQEIQV